MSALIWLGWGLIALVLTFDLWLARKGEANTISFRLARLSMRWPIIPFLAGLLCGHLFAANRGNCP